MPQNFIDSRVGQPFLLPPDPEEWLPEDHLAFFVRDALAQVDLSGVYARYRGNGQGRAAYEPSMMLAVLVYAHAVGVRSSRGIERRCVEDVAFRVLCGNASPDHATVARFFTRHRDQFEALFVQVLVLCRQLGMLRLGEVAVDGTKVKANASWSSGQTAAALEHQVREAQAEFEELARQVVAEVSAEHAGNDAAEDAAFGAARGDELPAGLRRRAERLDRMRRAGALARQRQDEADKKLAGAQAAWDARAAKAAAAESSGGQDHPPPEPPDEPPTEPVPAAGAGGRRKPGPKPGVLGPRPSEDAKRRPRVSVTDPDSARMKDKTGFVQGYNAQAAVTGEQIIVGVLVSTNPTDHHLLHPVVQATRGMLTSAGIDDRGPAGLSTVLADAGYTGEAVFADAEADGLHLLAPLVNDADRARGADPAAGRNLSRHPATARAQAKLRTVQGRQHYAQRGRTVEPIFGHLKDRLGMRQFLRRGQANVTAEWTLAALTSNLRKMHRRHPIMPAIAT
ncbi:MAG: transposase [Actinomycetota bacterium]